MLFIFWKICYNSLSSMMIDAVPYTDPIGSIMVLLVEIAFLTLLSMIGRGGIDY